MECKFVQTKLIESDFLPKDLFDLSENLRNHVWLCPNCRKFYNELVNTNQVLQKMADVKPPNSILNHYLSDLDRKIRALENYEDEKNQLKSIERWGLFRPVFSVAAIILVVLSIWWFGIRSDIRVDTEDFTTDSIDYYLDSFSEEAAQNSVASVKGFEYEWAYNINIRK